MAERVRRWSRREARRPRRVEQRGDIGAAACLVSRARCAALTPAIRTMYSFLLSSAPHPRRRRLSCHLAAHKCMPCTALLC
jgi:hypothetical protein